MFRKSKKVAPPAETITGFKGFDMNLRCRDFQYEIGRTYAMQGVPARCTAAGFHAVEMPLDAWNYYEPGKSRYGAVTTDGPVDRGDGDTKFASASITITAELQLPDFIRSAVEWVKARASGNMATGDSGHAAATGYRGHAAATGTSGHAAATGDSGHAAATGTSGHAAATGDRGHAAATGYSGHAAATGYSGHAAATGDSGHAAATGDRGIAASLGPDGTAQAGPDGWIVLAAWRWNGRDYDLLAVKSAKVGGPEGVRAGVSYRLSEAGTFEEAA